MVSIPPPALLLVALVVVVVAARVTVERSVRIARRFDVPDVLVAVSVVAVGTSLPEIAAHVSASVGILTGVFDPTVASATALGGNMGSSVTQQLLLFGLFLVGYRRFTVTERARRDYYVPVVLASLLLFVLSWDGRLTRVDGILLMGSYVAYTYYLYSHRERTAVEPILPSRALLWDGVVALVALVSVLGAAYVAVSAVETIVADLALGGSMAAVVTIGLAAALPELSTVVVAIRGRLPDVAIGTLLGSNVVNPLVAAGLGATISGYQVPAAVLLWDLPFRTLAAVALLGWLRFGSRGTLGRREGVALFALYFLYIGGRFLLFPGQ